MRILKYILIIAVIAVIGLHHFNKEESLGATITAIDGTTLVSELATILPANFDALNDNKVEMSTTSMAAITTLSNLATIGTIGTGVWNGTAIDISDYTNLAVSAPVVLTDDTLSFDTTSAISWTGLQSFLNASTTFLSVFDTAYFGGSATSSFDSSGVLTLATALAHEYGGLEADVNAYSGLLAISGGSTSEVDDKSELEAQIADVADFAEADGDTYTGTHNFSGATLKQHWYPAFTYATSTAWTGTTTIPLGPAYNAEQWDGAKCFTDIGTVNVSFWDGTNRMDIFNASTTVGTNALTTNNTFTASEKRYVDVGTPASTPTKISCTVNKIENN